MESHIDSYRSLAIDEQLIINFPLNIQTLEKINNITTNFITADEAFKYYYSESYPDKILEDFPELSTLDYLNEILLKKSLVIAKNTGINSLPSKDRSFATILLSSYFGAPIKPSPNSEVISWPIESSYELNKPGITFSQTNEEAYLHTDSQYSLNPEKYFGLFCIRKARDNGGISILVQGDEIIERISSKFGEEIIDLLGVDYPFRIPTIFTSIQNPDVAEINYGPIYKDHQIRYRRDTLQEGIRLSERKITPDQIRALKIIDEAIEESTKYSYLLNDGDAIFVNNYRMLHGRTSFSDKNRLLYRVRMN
jgi:alpha-ketoglutarate-dependent taurine dioxygenase